jgi:ANTAR domain
LNVHSIPLTDQGIRYPEEARVETMNGVQQGMNDTHPQPVRGIALGVWLVWNGPEIESCKWETLLDQTPLPLFGRLSPAAGSLAGLKRGTADVLLIPASVQDPQWLDELRASGKGVVIVRPASLREDLSWAESLPSVLVPASPAADALCLAVYSAAAAARREQGLRSECEQLRQKLQDRIMLERAKAILVRRLGLNEEDAYKRLRATARRERRSLREMAQSIVDSETLLGGPQIGDPAMGEDVQA